MAAKSKTSPHPVRSPEGGAVSEDSTELKSSNSFIKMYAGVY
jgi:hypothetical protein